MSDHITLSPPATEVELTQVEHPAWEVPIICRVEVDLPGWLAQLTGQPNWEVYSEEEEENCISFAMRAQESGKLQRAVPADKVLVSQSLHAPERLQAEVTLYHNGYAVVDVNGKSLFDGALTTATNDCARLSYYHMSGEPISLN